MHSKKELPTGSKTKSKKRMKVKEEDTTGYLNILVYKAKRLPCRENGTFAEPKVKW